LAEALIGLAVPGRPIGPWSRRTGAPEASATDGTGTPTRSVVGPHPTGEPWTTAVRSGHRTHAGTAGRSTYGPLTSDAGDQRSGVRVSPPAAASPSASCPRDGGHPGRAFPSGRAGSRHQQLELSPLAPAVPPMCTVEQGQAIFPTMPAKRAATLGAD
jgi:hypothetical protein